MAKSKRIAKKATKNALLENENLTALNNNNTNSVTVPKSSLKPDIYLQFAGNEYKEDTIIEQIKEAWYNKAGKNSEITSMAIYLKPEEHCVYYVINGTHQDKLEL